MIDVVSLDGNDRYYYGRDPTDDAIDHSSGDEADATSHSGTGADAEEVKEEMEADKPVSWVQGANVARGEG